MTIQQQPQAAPNWDCTSQSWDQYEVMQYF